MKLIVNAVCLICVAENHYFVQPFQDGRATTEAGHSLCDGASREGVGRPEHRHEGPFRNAEAVLLKAAQHKRAISAVCARQLFNFGMALRALRTFDYDGLLNRSFSPAHKGPGAVDPLGEIGHRVRRAENPKVGDENALMKERDSPPVKPHSDLGVWLDPEWLMLDMDLQTSGECAARFGNLAFENRTLPVLIGD
jgi:hypothetical protein